MARKRKRSTGKKTRAQPARAAPPPTSGAAVEPARAARVEPRRAGRGHPLDIPLLVLAAAGVLLTGYLVLVAWLGEQPAFCGAESDCDLVQSSRWGTFLGAPMALWGFLTYALLLRLLWRLRRRPSTWRMTLLVACVGAAVSWYLTLVSLLEIEATCAYCLASFGIMNALLVLLLIRRPAHLPEHRWGKALPAPLGSAAVVVLALALHFGGVFDPAAGPEDPYLKGLATHLEASGARFFGTYWCPRCQEQKALFAASASRLPYIECTPQGRGGVVNMSCIENDVRDYPTWIIGGRRHVGRIAPAELARLSGFRSADEAPRARR